MRGVDPGGIDSEVTKKRMKSRISWQGGLGTAEVWEAGLGAAKLKNRVICRQKKNHNGKNGSHVPACRSNKELAGWQ